MKRLSIIIALLCACFSAQAAQFELLAKAQPDEFVVDGGTSYTPFGKQPSGATGVAKINHDCIWGMAAARGSVWFGDVGNIVCIGVAAHPDNPVLHEVGDSLYRMCDFGGSLYPGVPRWLPQNLRNFIGDWRPPDIWRFNPASGKLERKTPRDIRIFQTAGLRAAGATDEIVFLAGPNLYRSSINLFAFAARSGAYLGSATLDGYNNVRRFVRVGNDLYVGVENASGGGSVLKWSRNPRDIFHFDVVGRLDAGAAYIAEHQGRLFVTTWPQSEESGNVTAARGPSSRTAIAGLWMSPRIPPGGLRKEYANLWRKVWDAASYEPDDLVLGTYGGGALCSFGGWLYWGTMQLPGQGYETFVAKYGTAAGAGNILTNTTRAISLFRGRNFDAPPEIELLYGETNLPVYQPGSGIWQELPNRFGAPKFGPSGFGNPRNCYTWSMEINQGKLFIGTFDYGIYLSGDDVVLQNSVPAGLGGDLYCIQNSDSPAAPVTLDGAGNVFNLGFRNMISINGALYLGTANASNLRDLPGQQRGGGWEFLRLTGN